MCHCTLWAVDPTCRSQICVKRPWWQRGSDRGLYLRQKEGLRPGKRQLRKPTHCKGRDSTGAPLTPRKQRPRWWVDKAKAGPLWFCLPPQAWGQSTEGQVLQVLSRQCRPSGTLDTDP